MKKFFMSFLASLILMFPIIEVLASEYVPHFLNYQSILYDDGGNLIQDGESTLRFKILDVSGNVLFEETQKVNVVNGYVSAIVGNGLNASGSPSGGIPVEIFASKTQLFLEVTADNYPPESMLEIVSVPYSIYAEKALTVADGSIDGSALKRNIIKREHLTDELVSQIADEMDTANLVATTTDLTNMQTSLQESYSAPTGAANIGTAGGLTYSSGTNVQVVMRDLDTAIANRQAELTAHANTNIAVAHPNGYIPISRLDTDVATQNELISHTHTGGSDGAKLNGLAFWTASGSAPDNSYVSIAAGFDVSTCSIMIAPYKMKAHSNNSPFDMIMCAKFCRNPSGNNFRVRCGVNFGVFPLDGPCQRLGFADDSSVEGDDCGPESGSYDCGVSYFVFCPR